MSPGDDCIVNFDGLDHIGRVEKIEKGWAMCSILIDPLADYGGGTERLSPTQTVCVPIRLVSACD